MIRILFVCMGNICRSPTMEGVFRQQSCDSYPDLDLEIDSAGTHAYHVGESPDARSVEAALRRGVDIRQQSARAVCARDFEYFDHIFAMDSDNLAVLTRQCPKEHQEKVRLLLSVVDASNPAEMPDPYYGGGTGFERVLDIAEEAARFILEDLRRLP